MRVQHTERILQAYFQPGTRDLILKFSILKNNEKKPECFPSFKCINVFKFCKD